MGVGSYSLHLFRGVPWGTRMATSAQDPANFLIGAVDDRVAAMGRHLGEGAELHVRGLVYSAVARLEADHGDVSPEHLQRAHDDLLELVDKAQEIAVGLDAYPEELLGERSYFPALSWFCPRYPFC